MRPRSIFSLLTILLLGFFVITLNSCDDDDPRPDNEIIYGTVKDIDGYEYKTVIIGDQEWMAENLRVTKYNNGDPIPADLSSNDWYNTSDGATAFYYGDQELLEAYGRLYNWYAATDPRGICPSGWSVPTDDQWAALLDYINDQGYPNDSDNPNGAANALKSCYQQGSPLGGDCDTSTHPRWASSDTHYGFDQFGFSALPGGRRATNGAYYNLGGLGRWWTTSEYSSTEVWIRSVGLNSGSVSRGRTDSKRGGFNIRCIKN